MQYEKYFRSVVVLSLLFISGCAFTRSESKIIYNPVIGGDRLAVPPTKHLVVADVLDSRGVQDPTTIFQKRNAYGQTMSGVYAADRPVAKILHEGIVAGLNQKGFITDAPGEKRVLTSSIEDYTFEMISGVWQATLKPKMIVRFQLKDAISNDIVWQDTIVGRTTIEKGDYIVQSVTATINDVVTQLVTSPTFIKAVK
jgi:hypothetical protein